MKIAEIREKNVAELKELAAAKRDELFRLKMALHTGQLEDPTALGKVRKTIARIETVLRESTAA